MFYVRGSLVLFFFENSAYIVPGGVSTHYTFKKGVHVWFNYSSFRSYDLLNNQSNEVSFNYTNNIPRHYNTIYTLFIPTWNSILFKGKSYRIKFFPSASKFSFSIGFSHITKVLFNPHRLTILKRHRQRFLFIAHDREVYALVMQFINKYRLVNVYTQRGLRVAKQLIVKRYGKISQAFSGLH